MSETLVVADLGFEVRRSTRRGTVGIVVDRDGSLIVQAPAALPSDKLGEIVRSRLGWVYTKLAQKELLLRTWRPKAYVPGEGHAYLGRHYRLAFVDAEEHDQPTLRLRGGWFELRRDRRDRAHDAFVDWYTERGEEWLARRAKRWIGRFGLEGAQLDVRDLGFRWGSCGLRTLNFHWRMLALPPTAIDYVIVHELAHVTERRHNRAFWSLVARAMPDFERRRDWLAEHGGDY